ncbi:hypothetical protein DFH28DRAFT_935520 [Melampsora americana]|nr:hypothetical protein DFH28DRAFT_935520 [Melampsora americana]
MPYSAPNTKTSEQVTVQSKPATSLAPPSVPSRSLRPRSPVRARPGFIIQSPDSRQSLRLPTEESDGFVTELEDGASKATNDSPTVVPAPGRVQIQLEKKLLKYPKGKSGNGKRLRCPDRS